MRIQFERASDSAPGGSMITSGARLMGTHRSTRTPTLSPVNDAGATPTTAYDVAFSVSSRPNRRVATESTRPPGVA